MFINIEFISRKILSSFENNDSSKIVIFAWSLILATIYFSPHILLKNPHFNIFGDVAILYFPQFVEGYHLAKSGAFVGIDFLTSNGSTAYFLRPNIPVYYPPYQLTYALFTFETVEGLARAFIFILYAHCILAGYYGMLIGRKYFAMTEGSSILFAVLYFGCISSVAFTAPPFYYVSALFPLLLYCALKAQTETNWWRISLYSFPYVMVFLSGYLPLDVNAVLIALIFVIVYFYQSEFKLTNTFNIFIIRLLAPFALASAVVLSLYLAMFFYNKQVSGIPEGVWHSAHQMSFVSKDVFALMSRVFQASSPGTGIPFAILGFAPIFLLGLAFFQREKLAIDPAELRIISLSLLIFAFYLLLAFGRSSGLPDMFYFTVPILGSMHLYGRYLLVASFFFYLAVAISFKYLVNQRNILPVGRILAGIFLVMFFAEIYKQTSNPVWLNMELLIIELLMISFIVISFSAQQIFYPTVVVIGVSFFIHAASFNSYTNSFNQVDLGPYRNEVAFHPERRELLYNYVKSHSKKDLIKYVDVTLGIEKPNGVMLNSPWLLRDKLKISNYMGYEPHLAIDRDYMAKFPYPYHGKINIPWLLRTGADFIIYNQASWTIHSPELEQWVDRSVPELDLWYGYKVAKLKDVPGLVDDIPSRTTWDFDNGIVRISNSTGTALVTNFVSDFVSNVKFNVESSTPATVRYALFPNKMMELRVDGKRLDVTLRDGLLEFNLPPGQHLVEYNYKNVLHEVFIYVYFCYIFLLVVIAGWKIWSSLRSWSNEGSVKNKELKL